MNIFPFDNKSQTPRARHQQNKGIEMEENQLEFDWHAFFPNKLKTIHQDI